MSEEDERPTDIVEAVHKREIRRRSDRRLIAVGAVAFVAVLLAAVLATLLWTNSQANVNRLAQSNDSQIDQFEYCKTAPKTDPRCQSAVSKPADKVVQGPQGIQGIQGVQGVQGEKGEKGDKGDPGTPCAPSNPACRGPRGVAGSSPPCLMLSSKCQGTQGVMGEKGDTGDKGDKGDKGDAGDPGEKGDKGEAGAKGDTGGKGDTGEKGEKGDPGKPVASWTWTDNQGVKYTCTDANGDLAYECAPESPPTPGIVGSNK